MGNKKFIKFYNVPEEYFDESGNLDPNAPLFPQYMDSYKLNKYSKDNWFEDRDVDKDMTEHFGKPLEYDNSTNVHPKRTVLLNNALTGKISTIGPNMKRGASALAYSHPDKRKGDDFFNNWYTHDYDNDVHSVEFDKYVHGKIAWLKQHTERIPDLNKAIDITIDTVDKFFKDDAVTIAKDNNLQYDNGTLVHFGKEINPYVMHDLTDDGGDFDWDDSDTYSDERLKDILSGPEVILSDANKKYIYNDFIKNYNSKNRHNNIVGALTQGGHRWQ